MVDRHPGRALGAVAVVGALLFFLAAMIGQHNDGPWGGLPEWMGAVGWFGGLLSVLVLLALAVYLGIQRLRHRDTGDASRTA